MIVTATLQQEERPAAKCTHSSEGGENKYRARPTSALRACLSRTRLARSRLSCRGSPREEASQGGLGALAEWERGRSCALAPPLWASAASQRWRASQRRIRVSLGWPAQPTLAVEQRLLAQCSSRRMTSRRLVATSVGRPCTLARCLLSAWRPSSPVLLRNRSYPPCRLRACCPPACCQTALPDLT